MTDEAQIRHTEPVNGSSETLVTEEALRGERLLEVARDAYQELINAERKLRRYDRRNQREKIYQALPGVTDVCAGISVFMGNLEDAHRMMHPFDDEERSLSNLWYQTALLERGDPAAPRKVREFLPRLDGDEGMPVLINLALAGDEQALEQLSDDMREYPVIISRLLAGGMDRRTIERILPPLTTSDLEVVQPWVNRKKGPPPTELAKLYPESLLASNLYEIIGSPKESYKLGYLHGWQNEELYKESLGRELMWRVAEARGTDLDAATWKAADARLREDASRFIYDMSSDVSALESEIKGITPIEILRSTGLGFTDAYDYFNDLTAEEKVVQAHDFLKGTILAKEFDVAESLLQLIVSPEERIMSVYNVLQAMSRAGHVVPKKQLRTTEEKVSPEVANRYTSIADRELLGAIFGAVELAQLDRSSGLDSVTQMVQAIADPGLRAKAEEAVASKYDELRRFAIPLSVAVRATVQNPSDNQDTTK
ncbi:hypothetical protein KBD20_00450 [Candidatus Saccharibacteria bacterium]|nr:hypothetical protein [Candidatus Saccharibacteria bacterium]